MNIRSTASWIAAGTALGLLSFSTAAHGNVLFEENFDYPEGDLGDSSAWEFYDAEGDFNFDVVAPGLSHPHLPGGSVGGSAEGPDGAASIIDLGTTIGTTDQTVFLSLLMQTDDNLHAWSGGSFQVLELIHGQERNYFAGLLRGAGDTDSQDFEHVIWNDGNEGPSLSLGAFNPDVNLFVLKFDYTNAGDALTVDAWLNPDDTTDFDQQSNRATMIMDAIKFDTLAINSAGRAATPVTFDQIRLAETAPTLVPEPGSLALLGAGAGLMLLRRRK